jgi:NADH-quinone oxidoreductase subunit H
VLMVSASLNMTDIVLGQDRGFAASHGVSFLSWNWLALLPIFVVYVISGIAETNRAPFDVVEGESEIVAGHMVEYSGMAFAMFFLAEYANMILISTVSSLVFMGGWLSPFAFGGLRDTIIGEPSIVWLLAKISFLMFMFLWVRASFPRYRYDQIMRLGWKVFIPITLIWIVVTGVMMMEPVAHTLPFSIWFGK